MREPLFEPTRVIAGVLGVVLAMSVIAANETPPDPRTQRGAGESSQPVSAEELAKRRAQVVEALEADADGNSFLLLLAPPRAQFAGDVNYPYRPSNDLYYLTGIDEPDAALLLSKKPFEHGNALLFLRPQSEFSVLWNGRRLDAPEAARVSGVAIEAILDVDSLKDRVRTSVGSSTPPHRHRSAYPSAGHLYFDAGPAFAAGEPASSGYGFLLSTLGSAAFHLDLKLPSSAIHPLRQVKSDAEIATLARAVEITCTALKRAIEAVRPGLFEYEVRALIESTFLEASSSGWGFPSIVASGANACTLHYADSSRQLEPGDLLLMDVGAEYGYYSADVTRTIPVSGRFTERQRALYEAVLRTQEHVIESVKPGTTMKELHTLSKEKLAAELIALGELEEEGEIGALLPHRTCHGLGLSVHDPSPIEQLAPGMVITIEPGVYLLGEGIGIRIEDDVVVTADGCRVLSACVPKSPDSIEMLMRQGTSSSRPDSR